LFVVEGEKMLREALASDFKVKEVYAIAEWWEKNELSGYQGIKEIVKTEELKKISNLKNPNQVLAVVELKEKDIDYSEIVSESVLVLDRLQDPGNLGTIMRTAEWFGVKNIICSTDSADVYNPKVVQATMGSIFRVNVFYNDLIDFIKEVKKQDKDYLVCGTTLDGGDVFKEKIPKKAVLVFGNESQGISEGVIKLLDKKISIPHAANSQAESLNVAVSVGVLLNR